MKNLKKLLALMVALVLALAFVGCEKEDSSSKKDDSSKEETSEKEVVVAEAATETVEDYLEALCDSDFEGAMEFVDKDAKVYDELEEKADGSYSGYDVYDSVLMGINEEVNSAFRYEIVSSEMDGDNVIVTVEANGNPSLNKSNDSYGEMLEEEVENVCYELNSMDTDSAYDIVVNQNGYSEEDFYNEYYAGWVEQAWDNIKDDVLGEIEDADMEEYTFELEKDGNDWIIVDIK